ncbi:M14 metallopeptidase family protein [Hufsiella ginkgonis]|uniref:Zinc carboxypeptidase n=1 Tax=Hufsiella ginkgonis TaxID=2695274 RepID=A0A7K1XTL0_9SPHI|nr:M14 metallopeptidase family protein [Hufsiella ginkgonis]MXV14353.1 zinc carboxypeptidase [Hufsiella ginkgonis]
MKQFFLQAALFFLVITGVYAQKIQSPDEFLGYRLGEQFTPHYRVVEYFKYIAATVPTVKLQEYGRTNESRPLLLAFIASPENASRLEDIRKNNLKLAGMLPGTGQPANQPAIVWLSYNVHGNEAVSTEASMKTLFAMVDPANTQTRNWLKNTVVIIDPCLNPDGRDRYVNFYNQARNAVADANPYAREHMEPWPGGRTNHYYFDLNRDWVWQTQKETRARVAMFNQWLPEIHVDFHEQGINEPYYFAPAAEPFHEVITPWQREFQNTVGKNHAKYFDKNGWLYFTRELFDLLYPSYGDTYPLYSGSIGMTYEQGGSGRAGVAVLTASGDTLTLTDRIAHHYTTGLSTVETASQYAAKLLENFKEFYNTSRTNPPGEFKTYVVKGGNSEKMKALAALLDRNGIQYGFGADRGSTGFNYFTGKIETFTIDKQDMVVSAYQPKSILMRVLFEPKTKMADSVTYDITTWSLPYAYGLRAFATRDMLKPASPTAPVTAEVANDVPNAVAYIANWNSLSDVKFLAALFKKNIRARYTETPVETGGKQFSAGSLIITRTGNEFLGDRFAATIKEIAAASGVTLQATATGFSDRGPDLGSDKIHFIQRPVIAVLGGDETSPGSFGQVWQFFEQQINYPLTVLRYRDLGRINLDKIGVLIVPDGSYDDLGNEKMLSWVRGGGKLIALEGAVAQLAGKKGFRLKAKEEPKDKDGKSDPYTNLRTYADREREGVKSSIQGAIFKVDLDNTHPLAFGFPNYYYTLKLDNAIYPFMENGWNVGVIKKNSYVTGLVGTDLKKKLNDGLLFGVEDIGNGSVVYIAEDILFRGFWENGKLLFSNAVFMVGN